MLILSFTSLLQYLFSLCPCLSNRFPLSFRDLPSFVLLHLSIPCFVSILSHSFTVSSSVLSSSIRPSHFCPSWICVPLSLHSHYFLLSSLQPCLFLSWRVLLRLSLSFSPVCRVSSDSSEETPKQHDPRLLFTSPKRQTGASEERATQTHKHTKTGWRWQTLKTSWLYAGADSNWGALRLATSARWSASEVRLRFTWDFLCHRQG